MSICFIYAPLARGYGGDSVAGTPKPYSGNIFRIIVPGGKIDRKLDDFVREQKVDSKKVLEEYKINKILMESGRITLVGDFLNKYKVAGVFNYTKGERSEKGFTVSPNISEFEQ